MIKTRYLLLSFLLMLVKVSFAQTVMLNGTVYATSEVENIHVINKTAGKATITNSEGHFFIKASLQDTLVFSGVQYKLHSVLVDKEMMDTEIIKVFLLENINQLDEVVLGHVLTGDLNSDIENSGAKPDINFYDVGIPGYQGKQKTQNERRLADADNGKFVQYYGIGFSVNIYKILNRISGRTKALRQRVELEAKDELMYRLKARFSEDLFGLIPLDRELHYEFFYFCSEDPSFEEQCSVDNELEVLQFLREKLVTFKSNLKD